MTRFFFLIVMFLTAAAPCFAQQPVPVPLNVPPAPAAAPAVAATAPAAVASPAPAAAAPADADDPAARLDLAQKLQALMPAAVVLESAIAAQAQSLPDNDRAAFRERILKAIDQKRLEAVSVKTMAELFSAAELKKMYDYFSAPEAKFIAQKMQTYQNMLQPEIAKMLDNALMEVRAEQQAPATAKP